MNKIYNNLEDVVNSFHNFFGNFSNSKTLLNFIPLLFCSIINSESITTSKVALDLFNTFNDIVSDVISRYKLAHKDNNVHISFDHMFVKNNFTILMFTLRIGKQGIPIYFEAFNGPNNGYHGDAFKLVNIKKGILRCHNLIKKFIPEANIIFLADRWFGNLFPLMKYIDSLEDTFVFRCKQNLKVFYQKYPEKHKIRIPIIELPHHVNNSVLYTNLEFTKNKYIYNLAYCKSKGHKESWLLITNGNPKLAKIHYGYRFGSIEFLFKAQKTNGFYLEECNMKKLHAFRNLYSLICIINIYLTCLGSDISKNSKSYKNIGFVVTKKIPNKKYKYRVVSRFRAGLTLFKMAINCHRYFRLPITFTLYDS